MRLDLAYVIGLIIFIFFCYLATYRTIERFTMKKQKDYIEKEYQYYKKRKEDLNKITTSSIKFPKTDNFYRYEKDRPFGEQLVLDVMGEKKQNAVDNLSNECSKISDCGGLKNTSLNKGCGFCSATGKFLMGNSKGPLTDVCPGGWSWTTEICKKNKEKALCKDLTSCLGMVTDGPTSVCGWCKKTNKAYVAKKGKNNQLFPKYPEDKCDILIGPGQCAGPSECSNKKSGPHNVECLRKIWKDIGCSATSEISSNMDDLSDKRVVQWNSMSTQKVFEDMKKLKTDADKCDRASYTLCYGKGEGTKAFETGGKCDKPDPIKAKVAASKSIANAAKTNALIKTREAQEVRKAAQVQLGEKLKALTCEGDDLWRQGDGTGLYVDQRIRDCNKRQ